MKATINPATGEVIWTTDPDAPDAPPAESGEPAGANVNPPPEPEVPPEDPPEG